MINILIVVCFTSVVEGTLRSQFYNPCLSDVYHMNTTKEIFRSRTIIVNTLDDWNLESSTKWELFHTQFTDILAVSNTSDIVDLDYQLQFYGAFYYSFFKYARICRLADIMTKTRDMFLNILEMRCQLKINYFPKLFHTFRLSRIQNLFLPTKFNFLIGSSKLKTFMLSYVDITLLRTKHTLKTKYKDKIQKQYIIRDKTWKNSFNFEHSSCIFQWRL
jgi:hypothetical protein